MVLNAELINSDRTGVYACADPNKRVNKRIILPYIYFPGGSPVSMQNSGPLFTWFTCFDIRKHGLHYNVLSGLIIMFFREVKGLTKKLYAYALDRTEICLHAKFQVHWSYG